jgi:hypothetical protein
VVVKEFGERRQDEKLYNHVDLVQLLDIADLEAGALVAGEPPAWMAAVDDGPADSAAMPSCWES